ncbi:MAG: hypothetical protein PHT51_04845 [Patescibacteria group bacterium]|nr:hypothetical protein [Patescibacteria group bacterium]MDD4611187.1 hypothetical protein [Patescibacteria group bacterium]
MIEDIQQLIRGEKERIAAERENEIAEVLQNAEKILALQTSENMSDIQTQLYEVLEAIKSVQNNEEFNKLSKEIQEQINKTVEKIEQYQKLFKKEVVVNNIIEGLCAMESMIKQNQFCQILDQLNEKNEKDINEADIEEKDKEKLYERLKQLKEKIRQAQVDHESEQIKERAEESSQLRENMRNVSKKIGDKRKLLKDVEQAEADEDFKEFSEDFKNKLQQQSDDAKQVIAELEEELKSGGRRTQEIYSDNLGKKLLDAEHGMAVQKNLELKIQSAISFQLYHKLNTSDELCEELYAARELVSKKISEMREKINAINNEFQEVFFSESSECNVDQLRIPKNLMSKNTLEPSLNPVERLREFFDSSFRGSMIYTGSINGKNSKLKEIEIIQKKFADMKVGFFDSRARKIKNLVNSKLDEFIEKIQEQLKNQENDIKELEKIQEDYKSIGKKIKTANISDDAIKILNESSTKKNMYEKIFEELWSEHTKPLLKEGAKITGNDALLEDRFIKKIKEETNNLFEKRGAFIDKMRGADGKIAYEINPESLDIKINSI